MSVLNVHSFCLMCLLCLIIRYQELYKTVLQKSEELQDQLSEQKQDSKNAFIEAKQELQDKGMEAFK